MNPDYSKNDFYVIQGLLVSSANLMLLYPIKTQIFKKGCYLWM